MTNGTESSLDGQWLDFYALLDVQPNADEATIRRAIARVYTDASANAEHRDLQKRAWYRSLCEGVLPQARRVLLDKTVRTQYDRQHDLHARGDIQAQPFVAFVASMHDTAQAAPDSDTNQLPSLRQDEIQAAREVVECAREGLQLELLPSRSVKPASQAQKPASPSEKSASQAKKPASQAAPQPQAAPLPVIPSPRVGNARSAVPLVSLPEDAEDGYSTTESEASRPRPRVPAPLEKQQGEPARVKMLTAQEANELRRAQRANKPEAEPFVSSKTAQGLREEPLPAPANHPNGEVRAKVSRVVVEKTAAKRKLSPTSLHLLVAITGVILTLATQRFAATPASATSGGRLPISVATSPEMVGVLERVQDGWQKSGEEQFELVVQSAEGEAGVRRILGRAEGAPDVWMPSSKAWIDRYNALAPKAGREPLASGESVASTPVVLLARQGHADELRRRFPTHRIPSWSALRDALAIGAPGRFGLSDPQQSGIGALTRFSMAREWGESHGQSPSASIASPAFWSWMNGFEANTPSAYGSSGDLVNDLLQGDASRLWWGLAYESDAIAAMNAGQSVEVWYLPRTIAADHPFLGVDRVGAPLEVATGRADFERFLRSDDGQKTLLLAGMRPARLALGVRVKGNPFQNPALSKRGLRATLPRDERNGANVFHLLGTEWAKRFK